MEEKRPVPIPFGDVSGWHLKYLVDDAGIVLTDVFHQNYPMASDMRVLGFTVEFAEYINGKESPKTITQFYPLNKETFDFTQFKVLEDPEKFKESIAEHRDPSPVKKEPIDRPIYLLNKYIPEPHRVPKILAELHQFQIYSYLSGLRQNFNLHGELKVNGSTNIDKHKFSGTQTYLFSKYSADPPHEPSGGLKAARIFPLLKFEFESNPAFDTNTPLYYIVRSIRADYKFKLNLSTFLHPPSLGAEPKLSDLDYWGWRQKSDGELTDKKDLKVMLDKHPQMAAVLSDYEDFSIGRSVSRSIFSAVEKPLIYEIAAFGLKEGFNHIDKNIYGWDNIHWWGGYKGYHLISAPGGFHTLHLHWRWGKVINSTPDGFDPEPQFQQPQFEKMGMALVDPLSWMQTIKLAIVKNDKEEEIFKAIKNNNTNFFALFKGTPANIENGDNLTLYFSAQLHTELKQTGQKTLRSGLNGTIFIHGMFFAHNRELLNNNGRIFFDRVGAQERLYIHPSKEDIKARWQRQAIL